MFDELNARLAEVETRLEERRRLSDELSDLEDARTRAREAVAFCEEIAEREQADLKALDGLAGLWSRLTGTYASKAEQEAQEAYIALRELDNAKAALKRAEQRYLDAAQRFDATDNIVAEYERLLAHKAMRLQQTDRVEKGMLDALDIEIAARSALLDEMEETVHAGHAALAAFSAVLHKLDDAHQQGRMDALGAPLANVTKHLSMRNAEDLMVEADRKYKAFFDHTGMLGAMVSDRLDLGLTRTAVADIAFDGLVVDMWVQGRIADARSRVESRREEVRMVVGRIADDRRNAKDALDATEAERVELLRRVR